MTQLRFKYEVARNFERTQLESGGSDARRHPQKVIDLDLKEVEERKFHDRLSEDLRKKVRVCWLVLWA